MSDAGPAHLDRFDGFRSVLSPEEARNVGNPNRNMNKIPRFPVDQPEPFRAK